ncbi:hypothetical protein LWI28_026395 [Acer negundo]|uniref:Uncharacterized protein n=1 Tax=Acer negundo TaxID=4023 RepID=A0AAD5IAZ3_ACENE|nr:hypothetical protein LWI28_026395 [Acer negundo]
MSTKVVGIKYAVVQSLNCLFADAHHRLASLLPSLQRENGKEEIAGLSHLSPSPQLSSTPSSATRRFQQSPEDIDELEDSIGAFLSIKFTDLSDPKSSVTEKDLHDSEKCGDGARFSDRERCYFGETCDSFDDNSNNDDGFSFCFSIVIKSIIFIYIYIYIYKYAVSCFASATLNLSLNHTNLNLTHLLISSLALLQDLLRTLIAQWNYLKASIEEQQRFVGVTSLISSSIDEVTGRGCLSPDVIELKMKSRGWRLGYIS